MPMRHLAGVAVIVVLTASTGHAQTVYQPFNWTGFYAGGHVGGAWADVDFDQFQPICCHEPLSFAPDSVAGGAQLGWQYQWSNWVTGIELSYTAAELDGTRNSRIIADRTRSAEVSDIFLAGLRLGYAVGRSLLYIRGGYAGAEVDTASHVASTRQLTSSSSGWEDGWNLGGGFEYAFGRNIVLGVQYDFIDLGETNRLNVNGPLFVPTHHLDIDAEIHTLTARLSYKLGRGS